MEKKISRFKQKNAFDMVVYDFLIECDHGKEYNVVNFLENVYHYQIDYQFYFQIEDCELCQLIGDKLFVREYEELGQLFRLDEIACIYAKRYLLERYQSYDLSKINYSSSQTWQEYLMTKISGDASEQVMCLALLKEVISPMSELNMFARNIYTIGNLSPFRAEFSRGELMKISNYYQSHEAKEIEGLTNNEFEESSLITYLELFLSYKRFISLNYLDDIHSLKVELLAKDLELMSISELEYTLHKYNQFILVRGHLLARALLNPALNRNFDY